jgi:hypothetical protein
LTAVERLGALNGSFDISSLGQQGTAGTPDQFVPAVAAVEGVSAFDAQQNAINQIRGGAEYQSLVNAGEGAILANASATGGLRGGNTQAALAQFAPQVLSSLINQQYSRLGSIAGQGQASAAQQANLGANNSSTISSLLAQQGAAQAGSSLASGQASANLYSDLSSGIGSLIGSIGSSVGTGDSLELGPF